VTEMLCKLSTVDSCKKNNAEILWLLYSLCLLPSCVRALLL